MRGAQGRYDMMTWLSNFWDEWGGAILWLGWTALLSVLLLAVLLVLVAYLILMDRKVWAAVQLRRGPNVVGPFGLLQSFADLLKFVLQGADAFRPAPTRACSCWRRWSRRFLRSPPGP